MILNNPSGISLFVVDVEYPTGDKAMEIAQRIRKSGCEAGILFLAAELKENRVFEMFVAESGIPVLEKWSPSIQAIEMSALSAIPVRHLLQLELA